MTIAFAVSKCARGADAPAQGLHNGEIVVESPPGEGTRFIVSLPKAIANEIC